MAYTPNEWACGDTLTAEKLNNIERGISEMNSEYVPTEWQCGDTITAEKLNKIEQGIASGGGSSDFSTAQMTVNDSVGYLMQGAFVDESWGYDDPQPTTIGWHWSDDYNYSEPFRVVMYKGMTVVRIVTYGQVTITATGNATVDLNDVFITGDCTITIS